MFVNLLFAGDSTNGVSWHEMSPVDLWLLRMLQRLFLTYHQQTSALKSLPVDVGFDVMPRNIHGLTSFVELIAQ